jgi:tetratricopeptide (TPR) repeat protein
MHMGATEDAVAALSRAAENYAGNQQLLLDASARLILLGKPEAALEATRAGVKRFPGNHQLLLNRADALRLLGRHDEAIELLRELQKRWPERIGVVTSLVNSMRSNGQLDEALATAERALDGLEPEGVEYAGLLNELAHCQQKKGLYERAFASVCRSGEIALATPQAAAVDGDSLSRRIESERQWIEKNGLAERRAPTRVTDPKLVFMVGFPRSGTTLLESMLAAHPGVKTSGEAPVLRAAINSLLSARASRDELQAVIAGADDNDLAQARDAYWKAVEWNFGSNFDCFIDKLPLNIVELPLIRTLFPEAKIVLSLRDPRDVCLSCLFQWFSLNPAMKHFLEWDSTVAFYAQVMNYWAVLEPHIASEIYQLRYEHLLADFPGKIRELTEHLELAWDDAILSFTERNESGYFHTPSNEAVREQVNSSAIGRWRHYPEAMANAESVLGPIIDRLQYR